MPACQVIKRDGGRHVLFAVSLLGGLPWVTRPEASVPFRWRCCHSSVLSVPTVPLLLLRQVSETQISCMAISSCFLLRRVPPPPPENPNYMPAWLATLSSMLGKKVLDWQGDHSERWAIVSLVYSRGANKDLITIESYGVRCLGLYV